MDRRQKPSGITQSDLNNALAEAHIVPAVKRSAKYWEVKKQILWENRQKILAGVERARKEGKKIGRPPVLAMGASIDRMRQRGMTWAEISRRISKPASTAFRRYDRYLMTKGLRAAGRYGVK